MANTSKPSGFHPVRYLSGAPYNAAMNQYVVPSSDNTALFLGDAVKLAGTGSTDGKYQGVIKASSGDVVVGVVVSMIPNRDDLTLKYRKASTERTVFVADNLSQVLFAVQANAAVVTGDLGLNVNWADAGGDTTTGHSGIQADISTKATTNTLDLKLISLVNVEDNTISDTYPEVLVMFNNQQYANQIAGA